MKEKRQMTQDRKIKNVINSNKAITLIALVVTIIVLLILARSNHCNINWRKWNFNAGR